MEKQDKEDECRYIFEVHIVGNPGTGKTSIINESLAKCFGERNIEHFNNYI